MNSKTLIATLLCSSLFGSALAQDKRNLVPDAPSKAPDYFCTWNLQGYVVNYVNSESTREAMNEDYLFGKGKFQNWIDCYPSIRKDMYFVMDDSWDIPQNVNNNSNPYLGTVEVDETRFPSFQGSPTERLRRLSERIKKAGWKGVGGWICAQKAGNAKDVDEKTFWTERLKAAEAAGMGYWKVDWGSHSRDREWRKMLTTLGKRYAPDLWIEHACRNDFIEFSDAFRTYDVENVTAQPVTIQRICDVLPYRASAPAHGLINCEDEPYIAAGLGCAIGVMRHQFGGNLPDGTQDITFPPIGRDIKRRLDEVVRGVRWHRIAEPFGVDGENYAIDTLFLEDYWILGKDETWMRSRKVGEKVTASAPARVSRGMPLPQVSDSLSADRPFVLASRYPNGATAIATIGRALRREYVSKRVGVTIPISQIEAPVGVFGYFKELTLVFDDVSFSMAKYDVYAQDLAGNRSRKITKKVKAQGNRVTIPGELLSRIGLSAATKGDISDPGLVIRFFPK